MQKIHTQQTLGFEVSLREMSRLRKSIRIAPLGPSFGMTV
jgi:hypothetical protein